MDFKSKNFSYETCAMRDLIDKAAFSTKTGNMYYLRHVGQGKDVRAGKPALLHEDFPDLSPDFRLPPLFDPDRLFSSVLRVSSAGLRVWTHYDVLDNVYVQVVGSKRAVLWAPDTALDMCKSKSNDNLFMAKFIPFNIFQTSTETNPASWTLTHPRTSTPFPSSARPSGTRPT